ncbi:glycerol-3-phosphate acyltransferase [Gudongella sp. DL1XJH-153]|uniref:glycerol-3-phosphate acyltransferase n=1 Tax=Gudongella sp. DL1XJH-153 TaxID=3409804 RepID=UPI003BB638A0
MENLWPYLITAAGGYLIGSISFARLVFAKLKPGQTPDLIRTPTTDGQAELVSHAVGATNVMIAFGPRWGMVVSLLDALKGFLPTLSLLLMFPEASYHLVVAIAVLIGHLWPVWHRFSGGGGNSSIMGMLLAISPLGLIITHLGGMIIGSFAPMLAFIGGIFLTIPWFAVLRGIQSPEVVFAIIISILYLLAELPEISQLRELKRKGHVIDSRHVLSMMKKSAATGNPVESFEDKDFRA